MKKLVINEHTDKERQKLNDQKELLEIAKHGKSLDERITAIKTLTDKDTLYEIANGGSEYIYSWEEEDWDCIGYLGGLAGLSGDDIEAIGPYYIKKTFDLREIACERLTKL